MFHSNKMFLWVWKTVLRVTIYQLLGSLFIIVIFLFLFWTRSENSDKATPVNKIVDPVIVWWTVEFPGTKEIKHCPKNIRCDFRIRSNISQHFNTQAYLFYGSNIKFNDLPLPRKPNDIIWGLLHEESPRNVEELMHEPILNLFNYSSTFSRFSDVPTPLQYLESYEDITSGRYFVETSEKNSFLKEIAPILYLQSDCETSTERDLYVKELMKIARVDSYGSCLNNKQLPEPLTEDYLNKLSDDEFLKFVARYKFVVAIENGVCNDYVTEKLWRAIKVGTVPIYFGCPLIRDWLPNPKSAILLEDFPTPTILNDHLNKLLNNDVLYEEYLEHKIEQIVRNSRLIKELNARPYQVDSMRTVEKFECFVCQKVHDKINGISKVSIVSKSHYNCPKPLSALQLAVNPRNSWVYSWESTQEKAKEIYKTVMNEE